MNMRSAAVGLAGSIVGTIFLGIAIWLTLVYTGAYNVAAADQHFDTVRWTLNTALHHSVSSRAGGVSIPDDAPDALPHLTEAATEWTDAEVHWIVSNGLKMPGMPAFGEHHSAEEITAIAAFGKALPGLSADDYAKLTGSARTESEGNGSAAARETPDDSQAN